MPFETRFPHFLRMQELNIGVRKVAERDNEDLQFFVYDNRSTSQRPASYCDGCKMDLISCYANISPNDTAGIVNVLERMCERINDAVRPDRTLHIYGLRKRQIPVRFKMTVSRLEADAKETGLVSHIQEQLRTFV